MNQSKFGNMYVILEEGAEPVDLFGEAREVKPQGFNNPLWIGIVRVQGPGHNFMAIHLPTGIKIATGISVHVAMVNAERWFTTVGEDHMEARLKPFPIINERLRSPYELPKKDGEGKN